MGGYFHHPLSCVSPVPFPTLPHAFQNSSARFGEYSVVDNCTWRVVMVRGLSVSLLLVISSGGCEEVHDAHSVAYERHFGTRNGVTRMLMLIQPTSLERGGASGTGSSISNISTG